MAEQDEIAKIKEDLLQQQTASMTLLGIVKGIDTKVDELTGAMRSLQVQANIVDARLTAVDGRVGTVEARLGAVENRLGSVETKLTALSQDMAASFAQVEATMATKADVAALETRMADSFTQLLAILDERLPKREE